MIFRHLEIFPASPQILLIIIVALVVYHYDYDDDYDDYDYINNNNAIILIISSGGRPPEAAGPRTWQPKVALSTDVAAHTSRAQVCSQYALLFGIAQPCLSTL